MDGTVKGRQSMHSRSRAFVVAIVVISGVGLFNLSAQGGRQGGPGQGGQQVRRDAREDAPEALIGSWVQNMEKSHYDPGPPLKSQTRTFDYTHDGMILCNYTQITAQGNRSVGHWAVTLDGKEWPEYTRGYGATVFALVGIKKTDEYNLEITVRRFGRLIQNGMWTLSKDGKTLTQVLRSLDPQGKVTSTNTAVFEKQE
jgi:hypothetical protein